MNSCALKYGGSVAVTTGPLITATYKEDAMSDRSISPLPDDLNTKSGAYKTWATMIQRCTNSNRDNYRYYGGRGISVCERWMVFANFAADMGPRPAGKSLDRIDGDGNYEPSNCRWATRVEQARNRNNNRMLTVDGETRCLKEWAEVMGIESMLILCRIAKGWSVRDAVLKPLTVYSPLKESDRPAIMAMRANGVGLRGIAKAYGKNTGDVSRFINRTERGPRVRPKRPKIADVIGKPTGKNGSLTISSLPPLPGKPGGTP